MMTLQELVKRVRSKPMTPERKDKLRGLLVRQKSPEDLDIIWAACLKDEADEKAGTDA